MRQRHKKNRLRFWGAAVGVLFVAWIWELLWRWVSREPKWFESYYNGVASAWPPSHKGGG